MRRRVNKERRKQNTKEERTKARRKNKETNASGRGRSQTSKFCVSATMAKESDVTPIGQQVLLLALLFCVICKLWLDKGGCTLIASMNYSLRI